MHGCLRCRDAISNWVNQKINNVVQNVTTIDEAKRILAAESVMVLGFLDSLQVSGVHFMRLFISVCEIMLQLLSSYGSFHFPFILLFEQTNDSKKE